MGQILTETVFSPQNELHTAKLCFTVLKHFWANSQETSLFSPKSDYLRGAQKYLESLFFSTCLKRGQPRNFFGFVVNNPFCTKQ